MSRKKKRKKRSPLKRIKVPKKEQDGFTGSSLGKAVTNLPSEPEPPIAILRGHIYYCTICEAESSIIISEEELQEFIQWHKNKSPKCLLDQESKHEIKEKMLP